MIVLNQSYASTHTVCALKCSGEQCDNLLHFDGSEHNITPMEFRKSDSTVIAIDSLFLYRIVVSMGESHSPLSEFWVSMLSEYTSRDKIINGISQRNISGLLPTRPTFLRIIQKCISESMIPYLPFSSNECIACSEMPPEDQIYVGDGTSVGFLERHVDPDNRLFNSYPDQLPPAICTDPNVFRVDLPKESCLVVTKALPWDQLSCFSGGGDNVDIQESVLGYALCKWKKLKSTKFSPYTNDDITTLHNLVKGKVYDDNSFIVTANKAVEIMTSHTMLQGGCTAPTKQLGHVVQAFAAKSVAPFTGTILSNVILSYICLSCGLPGDTVIPRFISQLMSVTKMNKRNASQLLDTNNIMNVEQITIGTIYPQYFTDMDEKIAAMPIGSICTYSSRWASYALSQLKDLECCDTTIEGGIRVIDCIEKFFPQLATHLRECRSLVLPPEQRGMMACLGSIAMNILLRDITYTLLKKDEKMSVKIVNSSKRNINLSEIISSIKDLKISTGIESISYQIAFQTLKEIMESDIRIRTSTKENAATGRVSANSCSSRLLRAKIYTIDLLNKTSACKAFMSAYYPGVGSQGKCDKQFPSSNIFTAGLFTSLCACKFRILKQ
jgi:hypothetical protein